MKCPFCIKVCSKCGKILVAYSGNFAKQKNGKYGLKCDCKICTNEYAKQYREDNKDYYKQYYEDNKEKINERKKQYYEDNKDYYKQYYEDNKEKIAEQNKQYYEDNKEKINERKKQYYEDNKEKIAEQKKQYYASEHGQTVLFNANNRRRQREQEQGRGITVEQWKEMMNFFNWKCAYSGTPLNKDNRTIDHIFPLKIGGLNEPWNCVPMYSNYNKSKNTSDMLDWYIQQDFYSEERLEKIYEWCEYAYNKWGKND